MTVATIPDRLLDVSRQLVAARAQKRAALKLERLTMMDDAIRLFQSYGLMIRADADMRSFVAFDARGVAIVTVRMEAPDA